MEDENPKPEASRELDIRQIMAVLPHRYPFLLIDRILESARKKRIVAIKNVTINEPFFQGHFPGYPVMPGVLIIEALAQVSVILVYQTLKRMPDDKSLIFFAGIDNARFKRQVTPGDQLILESTEIRLVRGVGKFAVRASVGDALVAEAELLAALRDL
jgi:3-hydroxyacyl-[acyl-carrier-protein] dehydratase